jgi:hypothetical protein
MAETMLGRVSGIRAVRALALACALDRALTGKVQIKARPTTRKKGK